jgi:hypothetical protein
VTSVINRYYDPATDQFLSIDPDVATTDQPYVFTSDEPLNAADPTLEEYEMGSQGGFYGPGAEPGPGGGTEEEPPPPSATSALEVSITDADERLFDLEDSEDEIPGLLSNYEDITSGDSIRNVATNVTPEEFGENLKQAGWKETTSAKGNATIFTNDEGAKFSLYRRQKTHSDLTHSFSSKEHGYRLKSD